MKKSCLLGFLVFVGVAILCITVSIPLDNIVLGLTKNPDATGPIAFAGEFIALAAGLLTFFNRLKPEARIWKAAREKSNLKIVLGSGMIFGLLVLVLGFSMSNSTVASSNATSTAQAIALATDAVQPANTPTTTPTSTPTPTEANTPTSTPTSTPTPTEANTPTSTPTSTPTPTEANTPTSTVVQSKSFIPMVNTDKSISVETAESISNTNPLQVHFIDVGQGDSILILGPEGETILIDGGEEGSGAFQYLQSKRIDHINLVVATHPHSDHIGGVIDVLNTIPVDKVVTNGQMHTTSIYEQFLDAITSSEAEYVEVVRGDTITVGSLVFDVLNPGTDQGDDLNNSSVVLRLVYGNSSFLFTGDAGVEAEEEMLSSGLSLSADILKVGHHGSRYSSSPGFLSKVQPKIAVYSAGVGNDYGHPHAETLAALTSVGAEIYGTDVNGTVIITADGSRYSVETANQGRPQAPPTSQPTPQPTVPQPTVAQPTAVQPTVSQPPAVDLEIDVVSLTSPIAAGGTARLKIKTAPNAACTITVYYKSGASQAQGLGQQTADNNGYVTWSWKVGARTTAGIWRIVVTAQANGKTVNKQISFEVK